MRESERGGKEREKKSEKRKNRIGQSLRIGDLFFFKKIRKKRKEKKEKERKRKRKRKRKETLATTSGRRSA